MKMLMVVAVALMLAMPSVGFGTPLHEAVNKGDVEAIKSLLKAGVDVNAKDKAGMTALQHVVMSMHVGIAHSNMIHEVQPKSNITKSIIRIVARAFWEMFWELLKAGADVNARDNKGWTALHYATESNQAEVIKELLKAGADVKAKDNKGWTALDLAEHGRGDNQETIRLLREADTKADTR